MAFRFRSSHCVKHDVGGESYNFYVLSPKSLLRMKEFLKPVTHLLSDMLSKKDKDSTQSTREMDNPETGEKMLIIEAEAAELEVIQHRDERRTLLIDGVVEALTDEKIYLELVRIVMDSLRDEFDRSDKTDSKVAELAEDFSIDMLMESLVGVGKANKKIFDPFLRAVPQAARDQLEEVAAAVKNRVVPGEKPTEEETIPEASSS